MRPSRQAVLRWNPRPLCLPVAALLLIVLALVAAGACAPGPEPEPELSVAPDPEHLFPVRRGETVGFIDGTGALVVEPRFQSSGPVGQGLVPVSGE
ncbi:MAG: WG repeat-containing protein, partial [Acidobacteriota bacterium]